MIRALTIVPCLLLPLLMAAGAPLAAARTTVLYVHDSGSSNKVYGYRISPAGTFTPLPGSGFGTSNTAGTCIHQCETLAYSARRRLLFATGGSGISVFRVAPNGQLSL